MKKQSITTEMIMEATISYAAKYGLENATAKKIAATISISEGSIFNYFSTKRILLVNSLNYIDNQIDKALKENTPHTINLKQYMKNLWYTYFDYLIEHHDYTKFYIQFRQSSYYDQETIRGQSASYNFFMKIVMKNIRLLGFNPDFFWTYIIESTLNFALHVAEGGLPDTPEDRDRIFNLMAYGFIGIVKRPDDTELR